MTIFEAITLGLVQGITEFIPVSSSGHLVIAEHFLGIAPPYVFSSLINLGTFLALVIYFRKKILQICCDIFIKGNYRLARNIVISAIPVGIAGVLLSDLFEQIQTPQVVAIMLVVLGLLMITLDLLPRLSSVKDAEQLSAKRAGFIGVMQAGALIPGVSRSGSTIVAGRLAGLSYEQAAEYSFLLSIPVMLGVLLKGLASSEGISFIQNNIVSFTVSVIVAFLSGMFAVGFMLRYLQRGNLKIFGLYRIILAAVVLLALAF
ncbi:MAG: undecaprenyl-diphosphate phosphatase [Candidatus Woesebacteria bacterium]|jgi:undecaprenyl-diphosphatase